jgi:hypothetical protein
MNFVLDIEKNNTNDKPNMIIERWYCRYVKSIIFESVRHFCQKKKVSQTLLICPHIDIRYNNLSFLHRKTIDEIDN